MIEKEDCMNILRRIIVGTVLSLIAAAASADLKVATSIEDLASVATFVGGAHVKAFSLCKGYQDPHFVPAKPSLMRLIRDADVFVSVGLGLDEGWLPLVLPGSRNPRIQPGAPGFVDASEGVAVIDKPVGTVSRAEGDVHPLGNPHYYMDPANLIVVASHLARVFAELDPANATVYERNAKAFAAKMQAQSKAWEATLAPYHGASIVTFHRNFEYFLARFGLKRFGTVEPRPGIPPAPRYLAELAASMKREGVRVVVYQPYFDANASRGLASRAGGAAVEAPTEVGGVPEAGDVFAKFQVDVDRIAVALQAGAAR
ncbi:MAG: metal ABC transporter substrate-binding protein [Candidatus Coatesbacteria bacterium]